MNGTMSAVVLNAVDESLKRELTLTAAASATNRDAEACGNAETYIHPHKLEGEVRAG
jgi:hypothetical protein